MKGEVYIRIGQNLMALPGQSGWKTSARCARTTWPSTRPARGSRKTPPGLNLTESEDTAKSAAQLAASGEKGVGAVASELAARLYGLEILASGIETHKQNFTRFLILDDSLEVPQAQMDKALLCFTLPHKPGSLAQILTILSFYEMNLTRIQSLPIPGREWQYFFYADIKFASYLRYRQALSAVRPLIEDLQILGEYKMRTYDYRTRQQNLSVKGILLLHQEQGNCRLNAERAAEAWIRSSTWASALRTALLLPRS